MGLAIDEMKLRCLEGPCKGQTWTIDKERISIGRDMECDLALRDSKISRRHAEIVRNANGLVFQDCMSTNGSLVNGKNVRSSVLKPGDRLTIGVSEIVVLDDAPEGAVAWDETRPKISLTIPLEHACKEMAEFPPPSARLGNGDQSLGDDETISPINGGTRKMVTVDITQIEKRLQNLQTLYRVTSDFTQIMVTEDLYSLLERTIFENFPEVERICLLRKGEDGTFGPEMIRTRAKGCGDPFTISRSVINMAAAEKVGIMASDAVADNRFAASESIIRHNVRSVICAPLMYRGKVNGALYLDNRHKAACFDAEDLNLLTAFTAQVAVSLQNSILYENVQKAYHQSILALINTQEALDPYTAGHTQRCCRYALGIAQEMDLEYERLGRLKIAAQLHDIGKLGIDQELLDKPGSLTDSEFLQVKGHVLTGERILEPIEYLHDLLPIIRSHHERFDGGGYPDGLSGEDIPLEARILAVADAFDAMTTQRAYNTPFSFEEALKRCQESAGKQFDPRAVEGLEQFIENAYHAPQENVDSAS